MAIPKSVTVSIPFIFIGLFYQTKGSLVDRDIVRILGPAIIFVGLYSILPHKELRFIFPALTYFNLAGAFGLAKM
jgi:alpha-1,6-mannosyltransferase